MSMLDLFKRAPAVADPAALLRANGIASPFATTNNLGVITLESLGFELPDSVAGVTRATALKVPAISKGRALLHSTIGRRPLRAYRGDQLVENQPTWLYRESGGVGPLYRTKAILDDLIFHEASLLIVRRGKPSEDAPLGVILDAVHCPYDRWSVDRDGQILVDDRPTPDGSVIWIPGPGPGLLAAASETIKASANMEKAWQSRVRNPMPAFILQEKVPGSLDEEEVKKYVAAVVKMRQNPDGAVMWSPAEIEVITKASEATDLFESGRNALRLDIANHMNLPASLLEGSQSTATLTYSTSEGKRNELFDYSLPFYADPIEEAFSLDSVVPRGTRVRFDFSDFIAAAASPTGPITED
jgi:hypothetical protein